ncbi:LacI family DNA-binding transcriptional regulator [Cellulomonas dongxiuzhuiae]|uniref:LacI family transcriptional regulator n=1 Tax=Cellulomonas dongxiuzhuiae TaxID=2819979 RepID=A0ABX8GKA5_9CELL|nr:LacI family DNA-binding transcriptional regulator [Cellulomonas dongxiuzhuiae]MBO3089506.1 LacI family DNA-binding transcriptional regulator [Cellulomonas dongxiuzhuiae]MBO3095142.1 LacI family DNA-binding transcriptional regulator [Cellulomonas dongxiuzhuiae]QWC16147.1 LacI family transcriptional regulator [Cellulomonas dongxiuzhuiae]
MARVTSADVARESGVSRTTVSYVLNAKTGIALTEATRQRVLETAARLGYTPSAPARALRSGRSDLVLCVLPDWTIGSAIDRLLDLLATALADHGLTVLVHICRDSRPLAELWRAVTPCAVLGLTPFGEQDARAMRQAGIPVVGAALDADPQPDVFAVPQSSIGALQADHLVSRGRRVLAYASPQDDRVAAFADRRLAGVRAACERHGLPEPLVTAVDLDVASASDAVRGWRAGGVTGVAAYNDEVALAVLAGLRATGADVPGDVAVIGVDDIPAARVAAPALTTVWQAIDAQADYLAAALLAALGLAADPPERPDDVFHVVQRAST